MSGKIRERLTYSNVMVTLLAFVVLGGTAWALAKNTVGPKQLKKGAVHTQDIDDGAVTSEKVADGTLQNADFAGGVLPGDTTVRSKTETVPMSCTENSFAPGTYLVTCTGQSTITATCEAGEHATGGGHKTPGGGANTASASVSDSRPEPTSGTPTSWVARAHAFGSASGTTSPVPRPPDPEVTIYAVCSA